MRITKSTRHLDEPNQEVNLSQKELKQFFLLFFEIVTRDPNEFERKALFNFKKYFIDRDSRLKRFVLTNLVNAAISRDIRIPEFNASENGSMYQYWSSSSEPEKVAEAQKRLGNWTMLKRRTWSSLCQQFQITDGQIDAILQNQDVVSREEHDKDVAKLTEENQILRDQIGQLREEMVSQSLQMHRRFDGMSAATVEQPKRTIDTTDTIVEKTTKEVMRVSELKPEERAVYESMSDRAERLRYRVSYQQNHGMRLVN